MKKILSIIFLVLLVLASSGCNKSYKGYWCRYNETATIVVLLNNDVTNEQKSTIENKINSFENLTSVNFYSKEDYATELDEETNDIDIYDTFVILFDSIDSIGTYIEELNTLSGVQEATQSNAKTNISLYNLKSFGNYTFTNSDEAEDSDLQTGKYKIKKGVITFTPNDKNAKTTMLYIKDKHLCGDVSCNEIYAESDETCSSRE